MRLSTFGLIGLLGLTACGPSPSADAKRAAPAAVSAPSAAKVAGAVSPEAASRAPVAETASCSAEIGARAAERLVQQCREVSPATHPPCNAANSCAMIRGEIERACALFAGSNRLPADVCPPSSGAGAVARHETPVALVSDYYAAIAAHDYARAYRLWGDEGKASGKSLAAFARGFAETATVEVETGKPQDPEGAAGSTYVTIPVTVRATTTRGERQQFSGDYVLRRVNGVPGATASQLDWRIASASLKPSR